jgi:hypothetical protein
MAAARRGCALSLCRGVGRHQAPLEPDRERTRAGRPAGAMAGDCPLQCVAYEPVS